VTYNAILNFRGRFNLDRQISFNAVGLTKKKKEEFISTTGACQREKELPLCIH